MSCTVLGWLVLLAIAFGGYCLYRRWQIRLYRKAKRDALVAMLAKRFVEAQAEAATQRGAPLVVNLDISNRKT